MQNAKCKMQNADTKMHNAQPRPCHSERSEESSVLMGGKTPRCARGDTPQCRALARQWRKVRFHLAAMYVTVCQLALTPWPPLPRAGAGETAPAVGVRAARNV